MVYAEVCTILLTQIELKQMRIKTNKNDEVGMLIDRTDVEVPVVV